MITLGNGRQLFFDDYLFERRTLGREFHEPELPPTNPIISPELEYENDNGNCPAAAPFGDGVFYDIQDQLFKMWYQAGWFGHVGYAESKDGINWTKPKLGLFEFDGSKENNIVWMGSRVRAAGTQILDAGLHALVLGRHVTSASRTPVLARRQ
jgi:hypothetical protein